MISRRTLATLVVTWLAFWCSAAAAAGGLDSICRTRISALEPRLPTCVEQPTERVGLALNLDADTRSFSLGGFPIFVYGVGEWLEYVHIRDPDSVPRTILLSAIRSPGRNAWLVTFWSFPDEFDGYPNHAPSYDVTASDLAGSASIAFDDAGRLIGDAEFPILFEFRGRAPFETPSQQQVVFEQEVRFRFWTSTDVTTQYASQTTLVDVENDGWICQERPVTRGRCLLSPAVKRWATDEEPESIYFSGAYFTPWPAPRRTAARLVSSAHQRVQGYAFDPETGEYSMDPTDVIVGRTLYPPIATQRLRLRFELAATTTPGAVDFDFGAPTTTSDYAIHAVLFDAVGRTESITIYLKRVTQNRWTWIATSPLAGLSLGAYSNSPFPAVVRPTDGGRGHLVFDAEGVLASVEREHEPVAGDDAAAIRLVPPPSERSSQRLEIDFGVGQSRLSDINQVLEIAQDGAPIGVVTGLRLSQDFALFAETSAGRSEPVSRLAFADRRDPVCDFACSNRRDDDGDGRVDVRRDPGCNSPIDGSERTQRLVCDDELDNDGDGYVDYPEDPGCRSPDDDDESPSNVKIQIVERSLEPGGREIDLVVAVLNRGSSRISRIDPGRLRLDPGGHPALSEVEPHLAIGLGRAASGRPDADCDNRGDRLFRFRLDRKAARRLSARRICLSGWLDHSSAVDRARLLRHAQSNVSVEPPRDEPFRACTDPIRPHLASERARPPKRHSRRAWRGHPR